jgi:tetratricopeptide (TPR) repeat protein
LNRGLELFPDEPALMKQKYYYLADLELYQSAIETARHYMAMIDADAGEYVILGQLLLEVGQEDEALKILETAKGKFPDNAKITMLTGHIYMEKEMNFTAAHFFKQGAYHDKKYLKDAVEMHRRIKDFSHAIYLNAQMSDNVEKLKQKVAIHLDRGEFEKVIGLKDDLERYDMLKDNNLRYAIAYSYYMAKDYPHAETHLKKIYDNELFAKGTVILRDIEKCRENSAECF